jgi:hypothetical protein
MCAWLLAYGNREHEVSAQFEHHLRAPARRRGGGGGAARPRPASAARRSTVSCNLDAVEADLLQLAPVEVQGQMASAVAHVRRHHDRGPAP